MGSFSFSIEVLFSKFLLFLTMLFSVHYKFQYLSRSFKIGSYTTQSTYNDRHNSHFFQLPKPKDFIFKFIVNFNLIYFFRQDAIITWAGNVNNRCRFLLFINQNYIWFVVIIILLLLSSSSSSSLLLLLFINLPISALGVFAKESFPFQSMVSNLRFEDTVQKYTIRRIMNITIRSTYYIFCCRNKPWSNPELIKY